MVGIPVLPVQAPGGGDSWNVIAAVIAVVVMGLALVAFSVWAGRKERRAEHAERHDLETPVPLPNAA